MEVEYYCARSQNNHLTVFRLMCILFFLCGCDGGERCKHQWSSKSSSSNDNVDEDACFVCQMKCRNNVRKRLDGLLATNTITSRLVLGKSSTSMYLFQHGVLPLLQNFSHPSSHIGKVFNYSLNFNIPWSSKTIPHLHSAHHGDCFALSQDTPMPNAWIMVVTWC